MTCDTDAFLMKEGDNLFDFCEIAIKSVTGKKTVIEPKFRVFHRKDIMTRGGDLYAIWDEENNIWRTDEAFVARKIDQEIKKTYEEYIMKYPHDADVMPKVIPLYMDDSDSNSIDKWHRYIKLQLRDEFHELDKTIVFQNSTPDRKNYSTKCVPYSLEEGSMDCYDELMSTLYNDLEREKLEWAIGSILCGDSKHIQKFIVLYGDPGSGKSTFLKIIEKLFEGYWEPFDAKSLGSSRNDFALEAFKSNPLVAIQHDGDLSRIEDNTKLNSLVSHEIMEVNEKFKSKYKQRFNAFIFMGTNSPVKITNAKSGILRRLIDVYPSGNKLPRRKYDKLVKGIDFELGAIAYHCMEVYNKLGDNYYDDYIPTRMLSATNDFYGFIEYYYDDFCSKDYVFLNDAWAMYNTYCEFANIQYKYSLKTMGNELLNYFDDFQERVKDEDGVWRRSAYIGFKKHKFKRSGNKVEMVHNDNTWLNFSSKKSILDEVLAEELAQEAKKDGTPKYVWDKVYTKLKDINTHELHYVLLSDEHHIVIDFDIPDRDGNKSLELNLAAAASFPPTYAELSKSGQGIHLHYIYKGDVSKLSRLYDNNVEVKVFTGKSSLRRKLSYCNNLPIATISSGLPFKEEKTVAVDQEVIKSERGIRKMIQRNLRKEIHGATKPSVDFIYKILEDAYNSGVKYDVSDLKQAVMVFASNSTHQADKCLELVTKMHFKSDDEEVFEKPGNEPIIFYDIEVYPNLFLVCWKKPGEKNKVVRMINPSSMDIEKLVKNYRMIGFNNRRYDNHILYARMIGYDNDQLYHLSQKIINEKDKGVQNTAMFTNAYNLSYTDIYDFMSEKQSLKKWEIDLGIHHKEMGIPWDEPVPEDKWEEVAAYCDNDVIATEALWNYEGAQADFLAREIAAALSGLTVNHTTNNHSAQFIFEGNKKPQGEFIYTDLSTIFPGYKFGFKKFPKADGTFVTKKVSSYRDVEEIGEGGYVSARPGMYSNVWVFDVASMHPSSIIALNLFGDRYTKRFADLVTVRKLIKHGKLEEAGEYFDGKLKPYLKDPKQAKRLSQALKILINSVYGLTSASFDNPFRDQRNADNIVAKRGALFMIELEYQLKKQFGVDAIHIKTDSIKIENPSEEVKQFIYDFGKKYGYDFEIEHIYEKFCLVNDAVYIAKLQEPDKDKKTGKDIWWDATGAQFKQPYVYKTLFSKEPIEFKDLCETKSVKTAIYLDMNEGLAEDEHNYIFVGKVGLFCPMKPGCGAGIMVAERDDPKTGGKKYNAVTGTKGYRWLESEVVQDKLENEIDMNYYISIADEAIKTINKFGDFTLFSE